MANGLTKMLRKYRSKPVAPDEPRPVPPFLVRHGDVLVQRVDAIPAAAQRRPGQVLVRGEATGHSHRVGEAGAGVVYETVDEMFLQITAELGTLVHEEHGPIELPRGSYRVWTQREYTPQRIVRVVDWGATTPVEMTPEAATKALLAGTAPDNLQVVGHIDLTGSTIPSLPKGLRCTKLTLNMCTELREIPEGLECFELCAQDLFITELPPVKVAYRLDLSGCFKLQSVAEDLTVGTLILRGCTSLQRLPDGLTLNFLDVTSCTALERLPSRGAIRGGRLLARGCDRLEALPDWLTTVGRLDISECPMISQLPSGIEVSDWLDIGGSSVTSVDDPNVTLRWRGVEVTHRIAFQPETITSKEVLAEPNLEVRRVLTERIGYGRFLDEVGAATLDSDSDPGGPRQLLRVEIPEDEPLVVLAVSCPSTQRRYLLRVPPSTQTCHQAAAWIAGFDDPDLYAPVAET